MNQKPVPFATVIREAKAGDLHFVINSWIKSYKVSGFARQVPSKVYYENHRRAITQTLQDDQTQVFVIGDPDDKDQIFSYCVFEETDVLSIVHYLYTKRAFRGLGFATKLLKIVPPKDIRMHTHRLKDERFDTEKLMKETNSLYNPYLFLARIAP